MGDRQHDADPEIRRASRRKGVTSRCRLTEGKRRICRRGLEIGGEAHEHLLHGVLGVGREHAPALAVNGRSVTKVEVCNPFVSIGHSPTGHLLSPGRRTRRPGHPQNWRGVTAQAVAAASSNDRVGRLGRQQLGRNDRVFGERAGRCVAVDLLTRPNGRHAIERVRHGGVRVVIHDMNFSRGETSGAEGLALFRELRREAPGVSVILMTSWPAPGARASVLQAGATAYLMKPWDDESLVAMVQRLLGIPRP
jgi:CheY-like chemotaxis protein